MEIKSEPHEGTLTLGVTILNSKEIGDIFLLGKS